MSSPICQINAMVPGVKYTFSQTRLRVHCNAVDPIAVTRVENGGEAPIQARAGLKPPLR